MIIELTDYGGFKMANIVISDLGKCEDLNAGALASVRGGGVASGQLFSFLMDGGKGIGGVPTVLNQNFEINQFFTEVNNFVTNVQNTNNQLQLINVNVESVFDSVVGVNLNQGQVGTNNS
jgi:hypothetical protein